jgi:phage terminase Nu1 subunit (DNA packaging protein)
VIAGAAERGAPWAFNLAEVSRWLQARAAEQAREPLQRQIDRLEAALGIGTDAGAITEVEARRRKRVAEARLLELEFAERSGALFRWSDVQPYWSHLALSVKERVRSIPAHARARIPGVTKKIAIGLRELCDEALTEIADSDGVPPATRPKATSGEAA